MIHEPLAGLRLDAVGDGRLRQTAARRLIVWHQDRNDLVAVAAIDAEVSVQREDS